MAAESLRDSASQYEGNLAGCTPGSDVLRTLPVVRHHGHGNTDVGDCSVIAYPPKTSRRTVVRSRRACSPFPVKLEPCMIASVLGFRSANFLRIPAVIGV